MENKQHIHIGTFGKPLGLKGHIKINIHLNSVDFLVLNGGLVTNGEYLMSLEAGKLINVKHPNKSLSLNSLTLPVTALAGIGNPIWLILHRISGMNHSF